MSIRKIIDEEGLGFLGMYFLVMFTLLLLFVSGLVTFAFFMNGG